MSDKKKREGIDYVHTLSHCALKWLISVITGFRLSPLIIKYMFSYSVLAYKINVISTMLIFS